MAFTGKANRAGNKSLPDGSEDLSDIVGIVSPFETPLLDYLGNPDFEFTGDVNEWVEAAPAPRRARGRGNGVHVLERHIGIRACQDRADELGTPLCEEIEFQKQEEVRHLLRELENVVINGSPAMRGMRQFIQTRVFTVGGHAVGEYRLPPGDGPDKTDLTEEHLERAMGHIWRNSHGRVDTIVANGYQKRRIDSFTSTMDHGVDFRDRHAWYQGEYGPCRVVTSRWTPPGTVFLLDSTRVHVAPQAGHSLHYLPSDRESVGGVRGRYSLEFRQESEHGMIRGLSDYR